MAAAAADPAAQQQQEDDDDEMLAPKVRLAMNIAFVVMGVILVLLGWFGHGGETRVTMWIVAGCAFLCAAAFFTCDHYDDSAAKRGSTTTTQPASPSLDVESAGELRFASNNPK